MNFSVNKLLGRLLLLYLILKPFYLWSSGLPQISDFIMVIFLIVSLFYVKIKKTDFIEMKYIYILALVFLFYTTFVNLSWSMILGKGLFITIFFYLYNVILFLMILSVIKQNPNYFLNKLYVGTVASLLIQTLLSFALNNTGRATVFFNNPNQLGFYALLMLSIFFAIYKTQKRNNLMVILVILCSAYLTFISLSKAAIFSFLILISCFILFEKHKIWLKGTLLLFITSGGLLVFEMIRNPFYLYGKFQMLDLFIFRLHKDSGGEGMLSGRGYDRIANHTEYLIFGAGEGENLRFNSSIPLELHSIPGTIFFSYGIIGSIIFLLLIILIVKRNNLIHAYALLPILVYGLTHNGVRNSLLWLLLSLLTIIGTTYLSSNQKTNTKHTVKDNKKFA